MGSQREAETTYDLYGLSVRTELPLAAPAGSRRPDIEVLLGDVKPIPHEPPLGEHLVIHRLGQVSGHAVTRDDDGYVHRVFGICDARISADLRTIVIDSDPQAGRELLSIFLGGSILAVALQLRGAFVLHASAVEIDGRVAAIVGATGRGKSSLAALLCARGAAFVTDDVLVCDRETSMCQPGGCEIRVRPQARPIADLFPLAEVTRSADDRLIVARRPPSGPRPLGSVFFPRLAPELRSVKVDRIRPVEALTELIRAPRTAGWTAADLLDTYFRGSAAIVRRVEALTVTVPWDPEFRTDLAGQLTEAVTAAIARAEVSR